MSKRSIPVREGGGGGGRSDRGWVPLASYYAVVGVMAVKGGTSLGSTLGPLGATAGQTAVGTLAEFGVGSGVSINGVAVQFAANYVGNVAAAALSTFGPVGIALGIAASGVAAGIGSALGDRADGKSVDWGKAAFATGVGMISALAPAYMLGTGAVAIARQIIAVEGSFLASLATTGFGARYRPRRRRLRRARRLNCWWARRATLHPRSL